MSLIIPANTLASGGYEVDNSLRFNRGSSDRLTKTYASSGNRVKWTFSMWVKRSEIASTNRIFGVYQNDSYNTTCYISGGGNLVFIDTYNDAEQAKAVTNMVFRDISAWYHIVVVYDKDNATSADKLILYVNGEIASLSSYTAPTQATTWNVDGLEMEIGAYNSADYFNGYLSEITFIDGTANAVTDFGEFDEDSGIWKPKAVSGLTFGTNGFYLDFENSGSLGADVSGNGNNFTVNNLTAIDQTTDTPTNNFATLNPLNNYWSAATFSEGNSVYTSNNTGDYYGVSTSTIGVSSGKWYFEAKNSTDSSGQGILGITSRNQTGISTWLGSTTQAYGYYATGGVIRSNSADTSYGASYTVNDIIGIYMDLDNNKMYVSDNGVLQNSGTGHTITAAASTDSGFYHFAVGDNSDNTQVWQCNFGGTSGFTVSSGNTDVNGYGNFEYDPSAGTFDGVSKDFLALCTKNLSEVLG
jgi:hypothetical protein